MSDSYQRDPHRGDLRKDQGTNDGNTRSDSFYRSFFLLVLGCTIAGILGAGVVILVRVIESETDGMNALIQSLKVLSPLFVMLVIAFVLRKKSSAPGRFTKLTLGFCAITGLFAGAAIWLTSPTQRGIAAKIMEDNRELFENRAGQLAACRAQLDDFPPGSLREKITTDQLAELMTVPMNLSRTKYSFADGWNTLLAVDTDFTRLKPGTNPDDIMREFDRPKPSFRSPDTYAYSSEFNEVVDDLAEAVYGDPYLWRREAEELLEAIKPLRYMVIIRAAKINRPLLTGEQFVPGYFSGEAFCFELEGNRLIAAFPFAATNSEHVKYTYEKNSSVTSVADSAMQALQQDLVKSAWPAFWKELHKLAPAAVSKNKELELPFKPLALREAMVIWMQKQVEEEKREAEVQEALERMQPGAGKTPAKLTAAQEEEVRKLIKDEGLIPAVKRIREITGLGLADSKAILDSLRD